MSHYEKLYSYYQNCYSPGAFGELGPRVPCCKGSLGSGFSFTTKSCRVKVYHFTKRTKKQLPVHVLLSFLERTKQHLPVYILFSFLERTKQSLAFSCSPFIYERTKETFACSCSPIISRRRKKSKKHLPVQVKISHLNKTLLVHVKISHFKKRTKESLACSCSPPLPDPSSGSFASAQLDPSEEFQSEIPVQRERGLFGKNQFSDISFYWPHDQE